MLNYTFFILCLILFIMMMLKTFLMLLIMLEYMLVLMLHVCLMKFLETNNDWLFVIILIMGVCESVVGISLMVSSIYLDGFRGVNLLNMMW